MRLLIGGLTVFAWFVISNHCVIDAALSAPAASVVQDECCPMHADKQTPPGQPNKRDDKRVCCKNLPATALKGPQSFASFVAPVLTILVDRHDLFQGARDEMPSLCLDTGPPGFRSFAEVELRRSLRAHAPPPIA